MRRIKQVWRESGKTAPATLRRRVPKWMDEAERIRAAIKETDGVAGSTADRPQRNDAVPRATAFEIDVGKKVLKASGQNRPDVAEQRAWWRVWQLGIDPQRRVFIDETWVKTNMTRPRGRAPEGERLVCHVPHGHWKTTTFLAALRVSGLTAPLVVDGAINGVLFKGWVEQQLVPTLHPGDIVVMDNLASHKVVGVRQTIERVGAEVVYPRRNPFLSQHKTPRRIPSGEDSRLRPKEWMRLTSANLSSQNHDRRRRTCSE